MSFPATHGKTNTRIFGIWASMLNRCYNKKARYYPDYGGRGIAVCDRWKSSFENFFADMGEPPVGMTLERKNNNGPYCKSNCIFASRKTQARNRRSNLLLTVNGKTQCVAAWADEVGISAQAIYKRLNNNWSHELAVLTPKGATR